MAGLEAGGGGLLPGLGVFGGWLSGKLFGPKGGVPSFEDDRLAQSNAALQRSIAEHQAAIARGGEWDGQQYDVADLTQRVAELQALLRGEGATWLYGRGGTLNPGYWVPPAAPEPSTQSLPYQYPESYTGLLGNLVRPGWSGILDRRIGIDPSLSPWEPVDRWQPLQFRQSSNYPSSATGQPPGQYQLPSWEQGIGSLLQIGIQIWQRIRAAHASRQAAQRYQRIVASWLDAYRRAAAQAVAGARSLTPASLGGSTVADLLQFSGEGGVGSLYGTIGGIAGGIASIVNALSGSPSSPTDVLAPYGDPWGPNILYSTQSQANAAITAAIQGGCGSPFVTGGSALRPATFSMLNPATGRATWFKPAGKPILWSADYSAARRVKRIGARARRVCGSRGGR